MNTFVFQNYVMDRRMILSEGKNNKRYRDAGNLSGTKKTSKRATPTNL